MNDSAADWWIARDTVSYDCSLVNVHCAASSGMPFHLTGSTSKLSAGGAGSGGRRGRTLLSPGVDARVETGVDERSDSAAMLPCETRWCISPPFVRPDCVDSGRLSDIGSSSAGGGGGAGGSGGMGTLTSGG